MAKTKAKKEKNNIEKLSELREKPKVITITIEDDEYGIYLKVDHNIDHIGKFVGALEMAKAQALSNQHVEHECD